MTKNKFQTSVEIPQFQNKTDYDTKNMFIGSCFTENVGSKMKTLKFQVDINPFGILYNPASIANGILYLLKNKEFHKEDLIEHNNLWHSFAHHGYFSSVSAEEVIQKINERLIYSSAFLRNAGSLFITFGTAWVYKYKKTGELVSNCHKIPEIEFDHYRLTVDEIAAEYKNLLNEINKENPMCHVIFTVSPVRHLKNGVVENQRSKAILLLAIDKILAESKAENCSYFPAYEIVMDELRDYRFYTDDMIHISDVAVNHVWDIFQENHIDTESIKIIEHVQKINKASKHRAFNKNSPEYFSFLKSTLKQIKELEIRFPSLNFEQEKRYLNGELYGTFKNSMHL